MSKKDTLEIEVKNIGEISDGYHTFNELYSHRIMLFLKLVNTLPDISWKSNKHADGEEYKDWFIAGMETPEGMITYHLPRKYWGKCQVKELENAPEWDGHTSNDVLHRLSKWL